MSEPFTLDALLDDAALLSLEHQLHLQDVLGEHTWTVDLPAGRFEFDRRAGGGSPLRCESFQLLGSAAPGPKSWLWSWASPVGFPAPLLGVAQSLREFGDEYRIEELATPEVAFADLPGTPTSPAEAVHVLTDAAKIVSGHWTSYNGDAGGGTRVAVLIEHPSFRLPPPTAPRVVRVLQQALAQLPLTDHRRAVYSYAARRPLTAAATPDWSSVRLTAPGVDVSVAFRGMRIASIGATMEDSR